MQFDPGSGNLPSKSSATLLVVSMYEFIPFIHTNISIYHSRKFGTTSKPDSARLHILKSKASIIFEAGDDGGISGKIDSMINLHKLTWWVATRDEKFSSSVTGNLMRLSLQAVLLSSSARRATNHDWHWEHKFVVNQDNGMPC